MCVGCQLNGNNESVPINVGSRNSVCVCTEKKWETLQTRRNIEQIKCRKRSMFVRVHLIVSNVESFHRSVYKHIYKNVYTSTFASLSLCMCVVVSIATVSLNLFCHLFTTVK